MMNINNHAHCKGICAMCMEQIDIHGVSDMLCKGCLEILTSTPLSYEAPDNAKVRKENRCEPERNSA